MKTSSAASLTASLAALTLLAACEQVPSSTIATHEMSARIEVSSRGLGDTRVTAQLSTGALTFVDLDAEDRLYARVGSESRELDPVPNLFDDLEYSTVLPVDYDQAPVVVTFRRTAWPGAPGSRVSLPERFRVHAPRDEPSLTLDGLYFEWDRPTDEPMNVSIEGVCIDDWSTTLRHDPGVLFVPPGALWSRDRDGCDVTVRFERAREGVVDRSFGGGRITARQVREVLVPVLP